MIKSINSNMTLDDSTIEKLDRTLAVELEERLELDTCPVQYCHLWYSGS